MGNSNKSFEEHKQSKKKKKLTEKKRRKIKVYFMCSFIYKFWGMPWMVNSRFCSSVHQINNNWNENVMNSMSADEIQNENHDWIRNDQTFSFNRTIYVTETFYKVRNQCATTVD